MIEIPTGSCNCGAVRFRISIIPEDVYLCHCSICRKATGGGGIAVTIVQNDKFEWVYGEEYLKTWRKPNHDWETTFCMKCGSPVPGRNDEMAMYIPVSLFDSGFEKLKVKQHLFADSKAAWEVICD